VRAHQASWEVWPLRLRYHGSTVQTGWTVELFARCPQLFQAEDIADGLLSIAHDALPADTAGVASRARPYDGSLRTGSGAAGPEVRITVEVSRLGDGLDSADGAEWDVVREIEGRLRAIGLHKRH
jgi:hypothetical protein